MGSLVHQFILPRKTFNNCARILGLFSLPDSEAVSPFYVKNQQVNRTPQSTNRGSYPTPTERPALTEDANIWNTSPSPLARFSYSCPYLRPTS